MGHLASCHAGAARIGTAADRPTAPAARQHSGGSEEEAGALDHKAVQLQLELEQAQRAHSDAQQRLQVST